MGGCGQPLARLGVTFAHVTHDQCEALVMSDRIAVMHEGRLQQFASPGEIYDRPANRFVAGFVGEGNFLEGTIMPDGAGRVLLKLGEAVQDLKALTGRLRSEMRDAIEIHLRHEPRKASRSRIKRLRGVSRPQFRLRVGEVRVFYDVSGRTFEVLAIVTKSEAEAWLAQFAGRE